MKRILIVDDNAENRYILRTLLQAEDYEVDEACHGAEALAKARLKLPLIVISDLLMPVMDGFNLLNQWKSDEQLKQVPFIVYTSTYTDAKDEKLILNLGADAFIIKPAEPDAFMARVAEVFSNKIVNNPKPAGEPLKDETILLKEYNEILIHKLEHKVRELEETTIRLMKDNVKLQSTLEELHESEDRYKMLFENTGTSIFIIEEDTTISLVNEEFSRRIGIPRKEIEGILKWTTLVHPGDLAQMVEQHHLRHLDPGSAKPVYEFRYKTRMGTFRNALINIQLIPGTTQSLASLIDVTDRMQALEALQNSNELLRSIFSSTSDAITLVDSIGKILHCNQATASIHGFSSPEQLIGKSFYELIAEEDHQYVAEGIKELMQVGTLKNVQFTGKKFGGGKFAAELCVSVVKNISGEQSGFVGITRDITERTHSEQQIKLKNEQLSELNAQKDKFFSIIAHDLRGPFGAFIGLTESLAEGIREMTPDELQEIARVMKISASNLYSLLGNLLEWSRMQRGLIPFEPGFIPLMPKISVSLVLPNEAANKKGIVIAYDIPEGLMVYADGNLLGSIFRNIIANAIKFTHAGGKVTISAKPASGNMVEISIKDTGIGMNQKMISNLFRLDINTSRKGTAGESSTGLGLILCKDFIEKHGGQLQVESEEGKGSTFRFTLPGHLETEDKIGIPIAAGDVNISQQLAKITVLIAEDDLTSEFLLSASLGSLSKNILKVKTGQDAVKACHDNPDIGLILMDIQMPEMDGYEATRQIRQFNKKVVIIAQTAFGLSGDHEKSIEAGCNDYISKPIKKLELLALIQKYFEI